MSFKMLVLYIFTGLLFVGIIAGISYVVTEDEKASEAILRNKEEITLRLLLAKDNLDVESAKLEVYKNQYLEENGLEGVIQDEYAKLEGGVIQRTDILFTNSGSRREIRVGNTAVRASVNARRDEIERRLQAIQNIINGGGSVSGSQVDQFMEDAEYVQEYIDELQEIIEDLTPENSGLTPEEIAEYEEAVNQAEEEVEEVITFIEIITDDTSGGAPGSTGTTPTNTTGGGDQSGGTGSTGGGSTSGETTTPTTPVTPEVIVDQQTVVDEIEEEIEDLVEELEDIEETTDTTTGGGSTGGTGGTGGSSGGTGGGSTTGGTGGTSGGTGGEGGEGTPWQPQPIIVSPEKPKLIQGSNTE